MASVHRATLLTFDPATWTAYVLIEGSDVEANIPVGQWVPASMLVADANVAVITFDPTNLDDAMLIGPYGGTPMQTAAVTLGGLNLGSATGAGAGQLVASGAIAITNAAGPAVVLNNTTPAAGKQWQLLSYTDGHFYLQLGGAGWNPIDIEPTAGSVTLHGALTAAGGLAAVGPNARATVIVSDGGTNTQPFPLVVSHFSSATPTAGFGLTNRVTLHSSNNTERVAADDITQWATATDGSQKARRQFYVYDTAAREFMRAEASGAAPMIGFLGATAVARPTITGSRGGSAALASLLTALANLGLITDSTTA